MNYPTIESEILAEIEWRMKELTILKTLPIRANLSKKQKTVLLKYSIPNIYSVWEGYVKAVFKIYINAINAESVLAKEMHPTLLVHSLDMKYPQLTTGAANEFDKKTKFIHDLLLFVDATVTIDPKLPTKSNINWEVVNNMLERFNLQPIALNPFERQLNSLLRIRNSVAHGENSIPIHQNMVDEQVNNVVNLMDELMFIILDGCRNFSYKK